MSDSESSSLSTSEIDKLIGQAPSVRWAQRYDCEELLKKRPPLKFLDLLVGGVPLVFSNANKVGLGEGERFDWLFLKENCSDFDVFCGSEVEPADFKLAEYLQNLEGDDPNKKKVFPEVKTPCPPEWKDTLKENFGEIFSCSGTDLVSELPRKLQPKTVVVCIGYGGSSTFQKEISVGVFHSLMVCADEGACSYWFCSKTSDCERAGGFWHEYSPNGELIENEKSFLSNKVLTAPFPIYVIKQTIGDLVIIPPAAFHQVLNVNGRNIKVSWNKLLPNTLWNSYMVLDQFHILCKPEVMKVKTTVYYVLKKQISKLKSKEIVPTELFLTDFYNLLRVMESIFKDEWIEDYVFKLFSGDIDSKLFSDKTLHTRTCRYCNSDIFNRGFHCPQCVNTDICLLCAAEGRGCVHEGKIQLMEAIPPEDLREFVRDAEECYLSVLEALKKESVLPDWKIPQDSRHSVASVAWCMWKATKSGTKLNCHQCKQCRPSKLVLKCTNCIKRYCAYCLWNRYYLRQIDIDLSRDGFVCPACNSECNCASCLRSRSINPSDYTLTFKAQNIHIIRPPPPILSHSDELVGSVYDRKPNSRGRGKQTKARGGKTATKTRKTSTTRTSKGRLGRPKRDKEDKESSDAEFEDDFSDSDQDSDDKPIPKKKKKESKRKSKKNDDGSTSKSKNKKTEKNEKAKRKSRSSRKSGDSSDNEKPPKHKTRLSKTSTDLSSIDHRKDRPSKDKDTEESSDEKPLKKSRSVLDPPSPKTKKSKLPEKKASKRKLKYEEKEDSDFEKPGPIESKALIEEKPKPSDKTTKTPMTTKTPEKPAKPTEKTGKTSEKTAKPSEKTGKTSEKTEEIEEVGKTSEKTVKVTGKPVKTEKTDKTEKMIDSESPSTGRKGHKRTEPPEEVEINEPGYFLGCPVWVRVDKEIFVPGVKVDFRSFGLSHPLKKKKLTVRPQGQVLVYYPNDGVFAWIPSAKVIKLENMLFDKKEMTVTEIKSIPKSKGKKRDPVKLPSEFAESIINSYDSVVACSYGRVDDFQESSMDMADGSLESRHDTDNEAPQPEKSSPKMKQIKKEEGFPEKKKPPPPIPAPIPAPATSLPVPPPIPPAIVPTPFPATIPAPIPTPAPTQIHQKPVKVENNDSEGEMILVKEEPRLVEQKRIPHTPHTPQIIPPSYNNRVQTPTDTHHSLFLNRPNHQKNIQLDPNPTLAKNNLSSQNTTKVTITQNSTVSHPQYPANSVLQSSPVPNLHQKVTPQGPVHSHQVQKTLHPTVPNPSLMQPRVQQVHSRPSIQPPTQPPPHSHSILQPSNPQQLLSLHPVNQPTLAPHSRIINRNNNADYFTEQNDPYYYLSDSSKRNWNEIEDKNDVKKERSDPLVESFLDPNFLDKSQIDNLLDSQNYMVEPQNKEQEVFPEEEIDNFLDTLFS